MDQKKYQKKIIASDPQDLATISALMSGAKVKISDMKFLPSSKIFLLSVERLKVENENDDKTIISSILRIDLVSNVKSKNIDQNNQDLVLELIAIDFLKNKENYEINLIFNNNTHIALSTEVIDVTLEDLLN